MNGGETAAEKKAVFPLLLTELVKNGKVSPVERTFGSLKPRFQATLERFCGSGNDKINELAKTIENADKENAPQTETAEYQQLILSRYGLRVNSFRALAHSYLMPKHLAV